MSHSKQLIVGLCVAIVVLSMNSIPQLANAQRRPTPPERRLRPGKYPFWSNRRVSRDIRHARDYSRDLYYYSRDVDKVEPEVAKAESEELGRKIEAAKKELQTAHDEAKGDKVTLAALESIEKHLANAAKLHKQLHTECCKETVDGIVSMECCNEITAELEKALTEHSALTRRLETRCRAKAKKELSSKKQ